MFCFSTRFGTRTWVFPDPRPEQFPQHWIVFLSTQKEYIPQPLHLSLFFSQSRETFWTAFALIRGGQRRTWFHHSKVREHSVFRTLMHHHLNTAKQETPSKSNCGKTTLFQWACDHSSYVKQSDFTSQINSEPQMTWTCPRISALLTSTWNRTLLTPFGPLHQIFMVAAALNSTSWIGFK